MTGPDRTQLELVEQYRQLAESYQALDAKIDSLIMANRKSPRQNVGGRYPPISRLGATSQRDTE